MEKQFLRSSSFEVWGGIECTINRVQDRYLDQLRFNGHYSRPGDMQRIASLGISKVRYPVLWEKHEPEADHAIDWRWTESRLSFLRDKGVTPIAGLVHHGSGPRFTSLEDPLFPEKLAAYAGRVAKQFPWLEYYTPVNEPLTTARFSGLYGIWYPHKASSSAFLRMLVQQVRAIILCMKAIREINPSAKLVQTEDLGKTYSTPALQYQADYENERRWLSYELLCGRVTEGHPLWKHLIANGVAANELRFFQENATVPDVAGFNYYITSERFLDDGIEDYPKRVHGGNGRHVYVDTEAVRVEHGFASGPAVLLREAWDRLGLPMALTEVYLSCTEEEQVRWAHGMVEVARKLGSEGIDIRAVTFWALLGEWGWNTLVTSQGEYESGAFDLRGDHPRRTMLASYIQSLTQGPALNAEWLGEPGWWQLENRFIARNRCLADNARTLSRV